MVKERRWEDAVHILPRDFKTSWENRFKQKRDLLVISGLGWDPRMTALLGPLKECGGTGLRELCLIKYRPSPSHESSQQKLIERNISILEKITKGWMTKEEIEIFTRREGNKYCGDEEIEKQIIDLDVSRYSDILIDISSLPKSLYLTMLLILVKKCTASSPAVNLHVIVCQDVELDGRISESIDDVRFLKGFKGGIQKVSEQNRPKIWTPILTGNSSQVIEQLHDYIQPQDIYPVLPFPAKNPRTDDDMLLEYHEILADNWRLNPMNIIYAAEDDPLDIYRSLMNLYRRQKETLEPLGEIMIVFSCLAGKISSLGTFMAALEIGKDAAVAHAIGHHKLNIDNVEKYWSEDYQKRFKKDLHSIWLTGEPYQDTET